MKVLVCGGRDFSDWDHLNAFLTAFHRQYNVTFVVDGAAPGADTLATRWAKVNGIQFQEHPPDYDKYDEKMAPKIRNQEMLDTHPDIERCIAFPGGPGTADMCRRATAKGVLVVRG